uniref:Symplekin/Pta1 N-terminal domain-containing protein n=1 Tax=Glossina palpalis gambiensis TaxID=67801 RepID=A0A1B0BF28_9MUSC
MMAPTPSAPARRTIHQPIIDLVDMLAVLHKKSRKRVRKIKCQKKLSEMAQPRPKKEAEGGRRIEGDATCREYDRGKDRANLRPYILEVIYPSGSSTSAQAALTERMHRLKAEVEVLQKEIQRMKRIALRERRIKMKHTPLLIASSECNILVGKAELIYNDDDGMRINAIKFLERIVGLQSYPDKDAQKKDNDFCLQKVSENIRILKLKKPLICSVNLIACAGSCVP